MLGNKAVVATNQNLLRWSLKRATFSTVANENIDQNLLRWSLKRGSWPQEWNLEAYQNLLRWSLKLNKGIDSPDIPKGLEFTPLEFEASERQVSL